VNARIYRICWQKSGFPARCTPWHSSKGCLIDKLVSLTIQRPQYEFWLESDCSEALNIDTPVEIKGLWVVDVFNHRFKELEVHRFPNRCYAWRYYWRKVYEGQD